MADHMKMVYDEAQALSHANGYMLISNSGCFMEHSSVIPLLDKYILYQLKYHYSICKLYNDTEGEHKQNKFIYDFNKQIKIFNENSLAKNKLDYDLKDLKVKF